MSTNSTPSAANHHADHPGFAGIGGVVAALSMSVGRTPVARLAIERTMVRPGDHVVDIGCGPGSAAREAARRGAEVVGIDPSSVMLRTARLLTRPGRHVTWLDGTAEALPLPDASFAAAWSLSTVHHWTNIAAGIAECGRVLRPGGRFLAVERRVRPDATGLASHGWTTQQAELFADACRVAGLDDVVVETVRIGRQSWLLVAARKP
jgi:ubiquinone/menaquinone biosynthesis C-methylase UbiE